MSRHDEQAATAAHRFYGVHQGEHLQRDAQRLIDRCAAHLVETFPLSHRVALEIAMQARAEIDSEGANGFIDLESTTPRMVVLRDSERKTLHMLSAGELLALVRARTPACNRAEPEGRPALSAS